VSALRDELAGRLGVDESEQTPDTELAELHRRQRSIAPEVLAGDEAALAELEEIEAEIATVEKRRELGQLADTELAARAQADAAAAREARRLELSDRLAELDGEREGRLWLIESAIDELIFTIAEWAEPEAEAALLTATVRGIEDEIGGFAPRASRNRWTRPVEARLAFRLRQVGLGDLNFTLPVREVDGQFVRDGALPLATQPATPCAICAHEQADEITAAVAARQQTGESLRAIAERFKVARTTLGRHAAHVAGPLVIE